MRQPKIADLLKRIEDLERQVRDLQARPIPSPIIIAPPAPLLPQPIYIAPPIPYAPQTQAPFPGHWPTITC